MIADIVDPNHSTEFFRLFVSFALSLIGALVSALWVSLTRRINRLEQEVQSLKDSFVPRDVCLASHETLISKIGEMLAPLREEVRSMNQYGSHATELLRKEVADVRDRILKIETKMSLKEGDNK